MVHEGHTETECETLSQQTEFEATSLFSPIPCPIIRIMPRLFISDAIYVSVDKRYKDMSDTFVYVVSW